VLKFKCNIEKENAMGIEIFRKHLREKRAVKVEVATFKTDLKEVEKKCKSAQFARTSAVCIPCDKKMYTIAKNNTKLPIFVSSIHPFQIQEAVNWGVDGIEIGSFYNNNVKFSADEIYNITLETLALINDFDVFTSVVIPGYINIDEQIKLVKKLEILGIDLIQIKSYREIISNSKHTLITDSQGAISIAEKLNYATLLPVMISSGITPNSAQKAFSVGVAGVGIENINVDSTAIIDLNTYYGSVVQIVSNRNSINRELIKTNRELLLN